MTKSPVTTLTDELIAELEENAEAGWKTEVHPSDAARLVNLISELKRDAERFRWLANNSAIIHSQFCEAIDAAMQNQ